jgi:hypothetical protein
MKTLVVGDVHQKIDQVEKIISGWSDQIIFIGDYFDDFNDTPEDARRTAKWLKESLQKPNRIHLMGNHDYNYRIRPAGAYYCTGFTLEKYEAINLELSISDWRMVKYFYHEKDDTTTYWFSHAGISTHWFKHPILGLTTEVIEKKVKEADEAVENRLFDSPQIACLNAVDMYRGGRSQKGGLLWNHWTNCEVFDEVTQIVGHTTRDKIKIKRGKGFGSKSVNVDTNLTQVLIIDNGNLIIKNV